MGASSDECAHCGSSLQSHPATVHYLIHLLNTTQMHSARQIQPFWFRHRLRKSPPWFSLLIGLPTLGLSGSRLKGIRLIIIRRLRRDEDSSTLSLALRLLNNSLKTYCPDYNQNADSVRVKTRGKKIVHVLSHAVDQMNNFSRLLSALSELSC
ncbi:hypothetical protein U0070_015781, partial [Myodes glareolus]